MTILENKTSVEIDARGPRFSAAITVVVLSLALVTQSLPLTLIQLTVFLVGATKGPQFTPYAFLYKKIVKPRLKSELISEDVRPPQFAQAVGSLFLAIALVGLLSGISSLFIIATGFALAAAFLNSVFNYCLGCEVYLLLLRARR
jgi:hypothetical protein